MVRSSSSDDSLLKISILTIVPIAVPLLGWPVAAGDRRSLDYFAFSTWYPIGDTVTSADS